MKLKYILLSATLAFAVIGCSDILDRPSKTDQNDDTFWVSEINVRSYTNEFYAKTFVGYGVNYSSEYSALLGYEFSDDILHQSNQTEFERVVPSSKGSTSMDEKSQPWQSTYSGPTWNFAWIRSANILVSRVTERMKDILSEEAYNHWIGIGRFFRSIEYANLARVFGDVPYYDYIVADTDVADMYKPRTPRNEVMDNVYEDWKFALSNVRLNDGDQQVNRYVVASLVSRYALFEGTTQKYYYKDNEQAKKFLNLAVEAADIVRNSSKFDIVTDFRSLFGSEDLKGNKDCILYRHYDESHQVTHSVATYCNLAESRSAGPTLDLIKSFICNDGMDYTSSAVTNAKDFDISNLIQTRDPRFEATFWHKPTPRSKASYLYIVKFIDRQGPEYTDAGEAVPTKYTSSLNTNDYPVLRYSEVLLNWIEAKAELSTLGDVAITQADIDLSINKIRSRPLDEVAISRGVKQTAAMELSNLPDDPNRDPDVSRLIWEIRRERRMEFAFEFSRIADLRRWGKLEYMNTIENPDLLTGTWVNFLQELPDELTAKNIGILSVVNKDGHQIAFDGQNTKDMVGFFRNLDIKDRLPILNVPGVNPYLSPVGRNNIIFYKNKGYKLDQTQGWASDN
ncbi:RagB/SusD family nutrient uptake outer membrane protein [Bacteroides propionicifaciens]|uniref:RagB/SusD family nutrient uptake outer membrane protein n=1 Tax=Bacteroides propionicifaciens TaxID=392838 RepID=UPI0003775E4C|nr:RagB/SusD family nutrient uptake outer membrane protein [Bacteroides propionicifaciens]